LQGSVRYRRRLRRLRRRRPGFEVGAAGAGDERRPPRSIMIATRPMPPIATGTSQDGVDDCGRISGLVDAG
jgi:hypothetical protein